MRSLFSFSVQKEGYSQNPAVNVKKSTGANSIASFGEIKLNLKIDEGGSGLILKESVCACKDRAMEAQNMRSKSRFIELKFLTTIYTIVCIMLVYIMTTICTDAALVFSSFFDRFPDLN